MKLFKKKEQNLFLKKRKTRKRRVKSLKGITERNETLETNIFKGRLIFAVCAAVFLIFILIINLYYLQINSYESYSTRSNSNRIRVLPVVPQRGLIFDRNNITIAQNLPVYDLLIFPKNSKEAKEITLSLNGLLNLQLEDSQIENIIDQAKTRRRFLGIEIANRLTDTQIAIFSLNKHLYPHAQIEASLERDYPFSEIFTHSLGYVSRTNQKDIDKLTEEGKIENYEGTTDIGKLGIEKYYEDLLHGKTGSREVEVNSHGQVLRTLSYEPPIPGADLTLTLDVRLQYYAKELLTGMRGALILIDPNNGELLVAYSNPSYDPNSFVHGISHNEYSDIISNPDKPLINRFTQGGYSPASTIKPIHAIMGLNEGIVTPTSQFFGARAYYLPGSQHQFRDWRSWGHGWLDMYRAIEVSADTYFYDLAYRAGIDTIHDYLDRFGFGKKTGIDIYEESIAINPSKEWKKSRFKQSWQAGDTVPIGIGQGYLTTTLMQLVKAHCTVANKGKIVTPHFLKKATDPKDKKRIIYNYTQEELQEFEVKDKSYWDVSRIGMYLVVNGPEGTGRRAFYNAKYKAAGKSGTAQLVAIKQGEKYNEKALKEEHRDNALFVAFAPFEKPRVLAAIILENEGGGSAKGAPIIRKLLDKYFELYPGYMGESEGRLEKFGLGGTVLVQ